MNAHNLAKLIVKDIRARMRGPVSKTKLAHIKAYAAEVVADPDVVDTAFPEETAALNGWHYMLEHPCPTDDV